MRIERDVAYASNHGERNRGDLWIPDSPKGFVLTIHGGGWRKFDKSRFDGLANWLGREGWGVFNINYRLLQHSPWPACGDDCLAAAEWLLSAKFADGVPLEGRKIFVMGASAGGHLALMTGLRLAPESVAGIISIAGASDFESRVLEKADMKNFMSAFFGPAQIDAKMLRAASPNCFVKPESPPLLCLHCPEDTVVPIHHSEKMVEAYKAAVIGQKVELVRFTGEGAGHRMWVPGSNPLEMLLELKRPILGFMGKARDLALDHVSLLGPPRSLGS
jgi:acetyl esterase/lipase